jgi:hypothetical protein
MYERGNNRRGEGGKTDHGSNPKKSTGRNNAGLGRAQVQTSQRNLEAFLGLAMKAQSPSRATIATLVDLKHPRQVAFLKQTNVSHGPQQVNNHIDPGTDSRKEEIQSQQTKLYGEHKDGAQMDTRATTAAGGSYPGLQTMAVLHGSDNRSRKV